MLYTGTIVCRYMLPVNCTFLFCFRLFFFIWPNPSTSVCVDRLSPDVRILSSLFVILLVFVVTTVLVKVDVSNCRTEFFIGTLVSVAVVSGASNLFSGSVFGISAHFPMRISQALISGSCSYKSKDKCAFFPLLTSTLPPSVCF